MAKKKLIDQELSPIEVDEKEARLLEEDEAILEGKIDKMRTTAAQLTRYEQLYDPSIGLYQVLDEEGRFIPHYGEEEADILSARTLLFLHECTEGGKVCTWHNLAIALDVTTTTLANMNKKEIFAPIIDRARTIIAGGLQELALRNKVNPTVAIFSLKAQHRWEDRVVHEHSGPQGEPIQFFIPEPAPIGQSAELQ